MADNVITQMAPGGSPSDDLSTDLAIIGTEDSVPAETTDTEDALEDIEPSDDSEVEAPEDVPVDVDDKKESKEVVKPDKAEKITPIQGRPAVKAITDKYPNFFKEFPAMRHVMFREEAYTNLFPTVDDAKEASSAAQSFNKFSKLVTSGNQSDFGEFLSGVAEANGLPSMAANFLPALYKTNRDMYFKVTTPIAASMLRSAYKSAKQSGNENLANAALHIAQYALGDVNYATGEKMPESIVAPKEESDKTVQSEREQFYQERYNVTRKEISTTSNARLRAEIRKGLDPNNVFNEFTTNLLVDRIMTDVGAKLQSNETHIRSMNSLWKHAYNAGFAGNWKDRIQSAYLSAARAEMPAIRAAIRASALAERKAQVDQINKDADRSANRKDVPGSSNATGQRNGNGRSATAKEIDWSRTSDLDILNDRPTLRKK